MKTLDWFGLHGESWGQEIQPESYSHPAKFARGLVRRIYDHAIERGWLAEGDTVLDPFSGVALGGLDAMFHGLHWVGVELEGKFVHLGLANISLWERRYNNGMLPRWGTATLLQGDSRELVAVLDGARAKGIVASPPYAGLGTKTGKIDSNSWSDGRPRQVGSSQKESKGYSTNPRNLGNMREGEFADAVVSSPPFSSTLGKGGETKGFHSYDEDEAYNRCKRDYIEPSSPGQLASLPEGDVDAVIGSPPTGQAQSGGTSFWKGLEERHGRRFSERVREGSHGYRKDQMGDSPGQLAAMPEGAFEAQAVVSSPPFEKTQGFHDKEFSDQWGPKQLRTAAPMDYGESLDNLGSIQGDTFWSAARQIVQQCHQVLVPGGVAIWVLKDFVRNKQRVPFCDQWRQMCEACGFESLEWIRAWLVEDRGAQYALNGDLVEKVIERKSFFRRLAEKKGSPRIDYEIVLVMRKQQARMAI